MRITLLALAASLAVGAIAFRPLVPRAEAASSGVGTAAKAESPFACNMAALTSAERTRHFDELGPKLRALKKGVRELPDGYEFEFPPDRSTYDLLVEWAAGERLCCPFFDVGLLSAREGGPVVLRLTGREGVKRFIEDEGKAWLER